jgi:hypothetical protein
MSIDSRRREIAREARAIVALAFRNGPIEDIHAGQQCPTCAGCAGLSRITDDEMRAIIKHAVNHVYQLLVLRDEDPVEYESKIQYGERYTARWDKPEMPRRRRLGFTPPPSS